MASTRALSLPICRDLERLTASAWSVYWVCLKCGIVCRVSVRERADSGEGAHRSALATTKESKAGLFKSGMRDLGGLDRRASRIESMSFAR